MIYIAYVPIPKDLNAVKSKVAFNLTKRQLLCFGGAALVGVPLFFLMRTTGSSSAATICMIIVMLPFFLLAMYEKNGQPLEKIIGNMIRVSFLRPRQRPYQTNNFYAVLERQDKLDKEVYDIVYGKEKPDKRQSAGGRRANAGEKEALPRGSEADRSRHFPRQPH